MLVPPFSLSFGRYMASRPIQHAGRIATGQEPQAMKDDPFFSMHFLSYISVRCANTVLKDLWPA